MPLNVTRVMIAFMLVTCFTAACKNTIQQTHAATPQSSTLKEIDQLLAPWKSSDAPGVAVAIRYKGETIFNASAGIANLEYDTAISPATSFQIGSVSKQFTAFAVSILASEGQLNLNEDIREYLPELSDTGRTITVRNLLNHTSGMRDESSLLSMAGWLEDDAVSNDQVYRLVTAQADLNFEPGESYEYNNSNYFLLAQLVERISGMAFSEFMKTRIFEPLGMMDTTIHQDRSLIMRNKAYSYYPTAGNYVKAGLNSELVGSTGVQTTPTDLIKWAANFETHHVGNDDAFAIMGERPSLPDGTPALLARGQELRPYNGFQTWSHGGRIGGFRAFLLRVPSEKFAISILSNRADFDTAKIAFAITDILLRNHPSYIKPTSKKWAKATPQELSTFVGNYELFEGVLFSFTTDSKKLYLAPLNTNDKIELPQIGENRFSLNLAQDTSIEFASAKDSASPSISYIIGLHGTLTAQRIELKSFTPSADNLNDYVGGYYSTELNTRYDFTMVDGQLFASHIRVNPIPLAPYHPDEFSTQSQTFQKVEFIRNAAGTVIGCKISAAVANDIWFDRL